MIQFGSRIEPLTDTFLIESMSGVSFRNTAPVCRGKVIGFDAPWEDLGSLGMTVFADGTGVRLYYRGYPAKAGSDASERQTSCLSVSPDGLHFTPVPVNTVSYDGITENNIVRMDTNCHNFAPFYDTNPACRPDERYKAIGGIIQTGGIHVYASPDGIRWTELADGPVITKGAFDSMNMAFYDPSANLYRCYYREFKNGVRIIQSAVSDDFLHWSDPVPNDYGGAVSDREHLYTNATRPIPGAEHMLVSFPMRFHETRKKITEYNGNVYGSNGVSDALMLFSRDGVHWTHTVREPWLAGGLYEHEWTQRNFITLGGIVEAENDFLIYVMKNYMWDDDGIWAYSVPRYRFMSLCADGTGGVIRTKPLRFESDDIHLNYATSAYGYVKVTVLDENGQVRFESGEIYGNELSYRLRIGGLAGTGGSLVIELNEAHLYAIGADMTKK